MIAAINRDRLLLAGLALPLLLTGLDWGLPHAVSPETVAPWGYDEVAPLWPLTEAYYGFSRSGVKYLAYPLFHYVVLCIAYVPYLAALLLLGRLHPAATYPFGLQDPAAACAHLTLIARGVTVAMALGVVLTVFEIGRTLFDRRAALWAAALTAVLPTFTYYGKTANLDVPYLFWTMLAVLCMARILMQGEQTWQYVLFGSFASLAICTKDQAAGFLAPYPFILVAVGWRDSAGLPWPQRMRHALFRRPLLLGLAASVVVFAVANNLVFGWNGFRRHLVEAQRMATDFRSFATDGGGQAALARQATSLFLWTVGPATIWAVAGAFQLARRRHWAVLGTLALPALTHHSLILTRLGMVFPRFLLPAAVFATLLGSAGLYHATTLWGRRVLGGIGLLSMAYALAISVGIDYALVHDARYATEKWIDTQVVERAAFASDELFQRLLPRVWDKHVLRSAPPAEPRPASGADADYILICDLSDQWLEDDLMESADFRRWLGNCPGYRLRADFQTPTILPRRLVRMINCIAPRVIVLGKNRAGD